MAKRHPGNRRRDRAGQMWTQRDIQNLHRLAALGCTAKQIGARLHRTPHAVEQRAWRLGVTLGQKVSTARPLLGARKRRR